MSALSFHLVDVFAEEPLTGNPLALVVDADRVPEDRMRRIAREFNQSETTFLVRPTDPGRADWRLRSFTPAGVEVMGAGHNALGAWLWLAGAGRLDGRGDYVQEIGEDLLPLSVTALPGDRFAVTMRQSAPTFGEVVVDPATLAQSLNVDPADLAAGLPAQVVSTGVPHLMVALRDRAAVDRARPDSAALAGLLAVAGAEGCYLFTLDVAPPTPGAVAYARFFNPTVGIAEDPATGTAAGPLTALLVERGLVAAGTTHVIQQGYALGRPSLLNVHVSGDDVALSGSGLVVASGVLHL